VSVGAKFTLASGTLTAYLAPFSGKTSCAHYGCFVTQAGEVWVTILAENGLARLDVKAMHAINPWPTARWVNCGWATILNRELCLDQGSCAMPQAGSVAVLQFGGMLSEWLLGAPR
jgi:hypothetical protein